MQTFVCCEEEKSQIISMKNRILINSTGSFGFVAIREIFKVHFKFKFE